jgi:TolB-like protein/ankyrin repeat protein/class 3 adenylate cyclase
MARDRLSGKLAVILHADVAGSTALVQQDEHLAHERIQNAFLLFSDTIGKYHGRVQELRGDALLAEFERASDAVTAALAFQSEHQDHLAKLNDDIRPNIRVGIALGEVIIADSTITGAGVVLAQRVEQLANPGGVCITAALHEALPKRMPFDLEDIGEQVLKGFDDPVRVYRVELSANQSIPKPQQNSKSDAFPSKPKLLVFAIVMALVVAGGAAYWFKTPEPRVEVASIERMAFPLPDKPSIAVLPFNNMSGDAEQEYFVDGMTEDLITDLSKLPELFVVARNSVFTYKGRAVKVHEVAEELGVRYVLEGSVRRSGDQVRINAQLIDATTGGHLWADRYDGSMADVFALTDTVTQQIVSALHLQLAQVETSVTSKTVNPAAYDAFLKGWAHYQRHSMSDLIDAVPYLKQAVQLDEDYAQAHAALAAVYWETLQNRWAENLGISREDALGKAKAHLEKAMKEPSSLAHWVASNILITEGKYEAAVIEAKQVVALDSNSADGYAILAKALELTGRSDESSRLIEKAKRLNPHVSPLHAAVKKSNLEGVKRLIADGTNVNIEDYYGASPLHIAANNGHAEIAALLVNAGADIEAGAQGYPDNRVFNATPLIVAAQQGHSKVAEVLIHAGADVNAKSLDIQDTFSAIQYAAIDGHTEVVRLLVASGVDVEATGGPRLETPLILAARQGHAQTAELLISKGANVNASDINGKAPLHLAAISGNTELVQLLLTNGANVNVKAVTGSYPGEMPLHKAALAGHIQIVELLLTNGADINAVSQYGYTPLRRAVDGGHLAIVKFLINKGADIATRDTSGVAPLHIIARTDNLEIAELLIKSGADINARDSNSGFTPLDYAQDGEPKMIKLLEKHGSICTIC